MTSAYLSLKYPEAKILAVEASLDNFKLLEKNTCPFENIHCIHAAAYSEDGFVNFGNNELSYNQKISDNGILTKAITVESLMKNFGIYNIDLMKIDIEGGETDLLKTNTSWLSAVIILSLKFIILILLPNCIKIWKNMILNLNMKKTRF